MERLVIRSTVLTVFLSLFPAWLMADAGHDLSVGENHSVIDVRLAPEAFPRGASFGLPQFRGYDENGDQIFDTGQGFETSSFENDLDATLTLPKATGSRTKLSDEIAKLVDLDGRPMTAVASDQVVLVKYWADWCLPCRFQARAVERVLSKHPEVSITVLNVEADPTKLTGSSIPNRSKRPKSKVTTRELPEDFTPESVTFRVLPKSIEESITEGRDMASKAILETFMAKVQDGEIPIETLMPLVRTDGKSTVRLLTSTQLDELPDDLAATIVSGKSLTEVERARVMELLDQTMAANDG